MSCSVIFYFPEMPELTEEKTQEEILVTIRGPETGAAKNFQRARETSQISWIMAARIDINGPDSKSPVGQKPLVNLRTVEYRSTLNIGWIPNHGVEFFILFITELHDKWRKLLGDARNHQSVNVSPASISISLSDYLPQLLNISMRNS